jgi:DNA gyrase subunit B
VPERLVVDQKIINSSEARGLNSLREELQKDYMRHLTLVTKDKEYPITGPISLLNAVLEIGRKGLSISRYKGLGEMNPEQLWETTLDVEARSLLQVRVAQAESAKDLFTTLMGDEVEPRREFIQQNALKVANLDI